MASHHGRLNSINQIYMPQLGHVQNKESLNGDVSPNLVDGAVGININVPDLSAIMQPTAIFGAPNMVTKKELTLEDSAQFSSIFENDFS